MAQRCHPDRENDVAAISGCDKDRSRSKGVKQIGNGPGQEMRRLHAATLHFPGVHDLGVQVSLDVNCSAIGQFRAFRYDSDEFELPPSEQPAFRAEVINQVFRSLRFVDWIPVYDRSEDLLQASKRICRILELSIELIDRFIGL